MGTTTKPRRVRMCNCPACQQKTRMHRASTENGVRYDLTVCSNCFVVFQNEAVESWMEYPSEH